MQLNWILKMAWRDAKSNVKRLLFFSTAIVFGIMAIVAIDSLRQNVSDSIDSEAKTLLGADFVLRSTLAYPDSAFALIAESKAEKSLEINFLSMAVFPNQNATRLCNVKAIEQNFPFYGKLTTSPKEAAALINDASTALIDEVLAIQFNLKPGDSLKLGSSVFKIAGVVQEAPGLSGFTSAFAPVVFIPYQTVFNTSLLQKGSRVTYTTYLKSDNVDELVNFFKQNESKLERWTIKTQSLEQRKEETGRVFGSFSDFLMITGFIALLLGCIGIGSAVNVYIKEKINDTAVLRCIGASQTETISIYVIQVLAVGLISGLVGSILGIGLQYFVPQLLKSVLPFSLETGLVWTSIIKGILSGLVVSLIFSVLPIIRLWDISPMRVIQQFVIQLNSKSRVRVVVFSAVSAALFVLLAYYQLGNWQITLYVIAGLVAILIILYLIGVGLVRLIVRLKSVNRDFVWKQGISNLSRPNNQTNILVTTLGFAGALIFTMLFARDVMLSQVAIQGGGNEPNMILFDIREDQINDLESFTEAENLPVMQKVPIVAMRIQSINGKSVAALKQDSSAQINERSLEREFRASFRDTLLQNENIIEGEWIGLANNNSYVPISLEENTAKSLNVKLGDTIVYNVSGLPISTTVASIRSINFNRIQTNFTLLFPKGVLENAPKFYVVVSRTQDRSQSADFQKKLIAQYPNVSVIDLELIIKTLEDLSSKISYVVQFMALFSLFTGILVLISTLINVRYQRLKENMLLRILGADTATLVKINLLEFVVLGVVCTMAALLLALGITYTLNLISFKGVFSPALWLLGLCLAAGVALIVTVAALVNRGTYNRPPILGL